jgi:choline dehydrogenase-like flavoprotein
MDGLPQPSPFSLMPHYPLVLLPTLRLRRAAEGWTVLSGPRAVAPSTLMEMDCVVGSGPSAVACASALLKRGRAVYMLDAGIQLEADRARLVQALSLTTPDQWRAEDVQRLKEGMDPAASGIPQKRIFGSDYPYRDAVKHLGLECEEVGLEASMALGGFSTVWGASMLPSMAGDVTDWPISVAQLAPHYKAVLELTGLSAERDALTDLLPLHLDSPGHLEASRQAQAMLRAMDRHREELRKARIYPGRARVAIKAAAAPKEPGCVYCGMCMYGCPYGYIYASEQSLPQLKRAGDFRYQPDVIVQAVQETAGGVKIRAKHRVTGAALEFEAERVYLAAGVIPTTGILLRSLGAYDQPVEIKDSQYFLLPVALAKRIPNVRHEPLHALSQLYLEILDPEVSPYTVHLQVYSYNDLIGRTVSRTLGPLAQWLPFLARELEGRLLLIQGFIHSAQSSRILATLRKSPTDGKETLRLQGEVNPLAKAVVRRVVRKLLGQSLRLGALPLPMLLQMGKPGRSFHAGGSFPMRAKPGALETDANGRPAGWRWVHAVDATVLPSIPATTITLTVMANAHRIGWESGATSA